MVTCTKEAEQAQTLTSQCQLSAVPGESDPYKLLVDYQRLLISSLKIYLSKIETTFAIRLSSLIEKIGGMDPTIRFSPAIFSAYVHIKEGYANKDPHLIFDMMQMLKNLPLSELYAPHFHCSTILTESWEYTVLPFLRHAQPQDEEGRPIGEKIRILPLVHWINEDFPPESLSQALALLKKCDSELNEEIECYLSSIKLFSGKMLGGVTAPRFFGTIYLRLPHENQDPFLFYFENIVHEISHLHLYAMMAQDPLVLNPDHERFTSPLRLDKRPMSGIYHASFILSRIYRAVTRLRDLHSSEAIPRILDETRNAFEQACHTIESQGKLTDAGRGVFESMKRCAYSGALCHT